MLLVEDDPEIVGLLTDFLAVEGFGVLAADRAPVAIDALDRDGVDCVLLDVMLPASTSAGASVSARTSRCCSSAHAARTRTSSAGWPWAPTTTSSSRPRPRRSWHA